LNIKDPFSFNDLKVYSLVEAKKNNVDLDYFHCEKEEFNDHYFKVLQRDDSNVLGKAFLFAYDKKVVGYIVLSMSQLNKSMHKDLGHIALTVSNIPSLLIGRMARHMDYKGKGIGVLMKDYALKKAIDLSEQIGCRLLSLEAVPDKIDLYSKWGFKLIESEYRNTMFIDLLKINRI
jgi:predicted GNAT family N-acyltransferase